jgi:hypothetical protein
MMSATEDDRAPEQEEGRGEVPQEGETGTPGTDRLTGEEPEQPPAPGSPRR